MPRFDEVNQNRSEFEWVNGIGGAEIFASWITGYAQISDEFLTDANGFDIMSRKVYK